MQNRNDDAMAEAMRLAQSPAGQQLLQILRKTGGEQLQQAIAKAAAGDYDQAKQTICQLMEDPEAQKLLSQLGR